MKDEVSHLEVPIPPGRREEWAALLAETASDKDRERQTSLFLFRVGAEWFGLDPALLSMTIPWTQSRRLPHRKSGVVEGVISADGRVIVCLSLERFAGVLPGGSAASTRRTLVLSWKKEPFAIGVDEVMGVEDVNVDQLSPLPSSAGETLQKCARGVVLYKGRMVICLESETFVGQLVEAMQ